MRGFFMSAWFIHILICALLGWIAAILLRADRTHGVGMNILAGLGGAWIAGFFTSGGLISREPTLLSLAVALAGAITVVGAINLVRKGRLRP
jgi:uncharacterized membrane protein YeaQ/YmgE (transglycosylase-associated protein family)